MTTFFASSPVTVAVLCVYAVMLLGATAETATPLPANITLANCNPYTLTISGFGAGASMATQFKYAWSTIVHGAALIAGTPYLCAAGTLAGATACLDTPLIEEPAVFYAAAEESVSLNLIDPLSNLQNQTVFLFSGTDDTVVRQPNMNNVLQMLRLAGASSRVTTMFNTSAAFAWITSKYGAPCETYGSPYVNNCGIDFAGEFFKQVFHDLHLPFNLTEGAVDPSHLFSFDQTKFGANQQLNSMAATGFVYIPLMCQEPNGPQCHLHIHWHGCDQSSSTLGSAYVLQTELNEWAESNHIIVVYPQAAVNDLFGNPLACFDWWGYAAEDYALKTGPQITTVRYMIEHFGGF
mmetsp:Transcript_18427/g.21219  ORF Transcript_18427/g.21219 Transcript_18427/m.21219 type:complete len:350 (-) Transcript_18427:98-1147(-)